MKILYQYRAVSIVREDRVLWQNLLGFISSDAMSRLYKVVPKIKLGPWKPYRGRQCWKFH